MEQVQKEVFEKKDITSLPQMQASENRSDDKAKALTTLSNTFEEENDSVEAIIVRDKVMGDLIESKLFFKPDSVETYTETSPDESKSKHFTSQNLFEASKTKFHAPSNDSTYLQLSTKQSIINHY